MLVTQPIQLLVAPWTVAHQASLSMGFSRQEYWSGYPFPPLQDIFSTQGLNLGLLYYRQIDTHKSFEFSFLPLPRAVGKFLLVLRSTLCVKLLIELAFQSGAGQLELADGSTQNPRL